MADAILTQEQVKNIFNYNPETGIFTWKIKIHTINIGDVAGTKDNGYIRLKYKKKQYLAHRLAWLYVYGYYPNHFIDHIDGNRSNNKISNLRVATNAQNQWNCGKSKTNKSGFKGVNPVKNSKKNKYYAMAQYNRNWHYLGTYETAELASEAYIDFVNKNHGEFAYKALKR